jgi:hypothetical protein
MRIYLACPYTHRLAARRRERFEAATMAAAALMARGHIVYSPITHGHPIGILGRVPGDWSYWKDHCLSFLRGWAEELHIVCMPGWEDSTGVQAEIQMAADMGLPVRHMQPTASTQKTCLPIGTSEQPRRFELVTTNACIPAIRDMRHDRLVAMFFRDRNKPESAERMAAVCVDALHTVIATHQADRKGVPHE